MEEGKKVEAGLASSERHRRRVLLCRHKAITTGLTAVLLWAMPSASLGETGSTLFLSRLAFDGAWDATVVVINPSRTPTNAKLLAYDEGGSLLSEASDRFVLGPGERRVWSQGRGAFPERSAALRVESDGPLITYLQIESRDGSGLEAILPSPRPETALTFPMIGGIKPWWSQLSLLNTGVATTGPEVMALDKDGRVLGSRLLPPLRPMGNHTIMIGELFDSPILASLATIRIVADQPLSGLQVFGSEDRVDVAALTASLDLGRKFFLPVFQQWAGVALWNVVGFLNPGDGPASVTVEAFDSGRTSLGHLSSFTSLPRFASHRFATTNISGSLPVGTAFLKISANEPIGAYVVIGSLDSQGLTAVGALRENESGVGYDLIGSDDGKVLAAIPAIVDSAGGVVVTLADAKRGYWKSAVNWSQANAWFAGESERQASVRTKVSAVPQEQCNLKVSGFVTLPDGAPRRGVKIEIVGRTQGKFATTGNDGKYSIQELCSGGTLTPTKDGYAFSPSSYPISRPKKGKKVKVDFTARIVSDDQPRLKAPWDGEARITQGNNNSCKEKGCSHRERGTWDNKFALDIQRFDDNGQPFAFDILAPASGRVTDLYNGAGESGWGGGRQLALEVTGPTGKRFKIVFLHLSEIRSDLVEAFNVHREVRVEEGEILGKAGRSGCKDEGKGKSCGEKTHHLHLHFHIWDNYGARADSHTMPIGQIELRPRIASSSRSYGAVGIYESKNDGDDLSDKSSLDSSSFNPKLLCELMSGVQNPSRCFLSTNKPSGPPGSIVTRFVIDNDAASTISRTVTLNNAATGSPTQYQASESASFTGASWQAYSTAPSFALSVGNGIKMVYFRVRNSALIESGVVSDTIMLDESDATAFSLAAPNSGESWPVGTTQTIRWTYTGSPGSAVKIELLKGGVFNFLITPSTAIGSGGTGFYAWSIPETQTLGIDYKVKATSTTNAAYTDTSDGDFTITPIGFSASGRVTTGGGGGITGVTMTFTRVSGSGTIPAAASTDANGNWSQTNFQSGTTYRVTPSKAGYTFSPTSRDFNSASTGLNFTGTQVGNSPDLVVTQVAGPSCGGIGGTGQFTATVLNQGNGFASATSTGFYLSTDSTVNTSDLSLGSCGTSSLNPNQSTQCSAILTIPNTPGTYFIGAIANESNAGVIESNTRNNALAGGQITVSGNCPGALGTILVQATLNGNPITLTSGSFTLTGPGETMNWTGGIPSTFTEKAAGTWTISNITNGPANSSLTSVAPSSTQTLSGGSTITFTLNFSGTFLPDLQILDLNPPSGQQAVIGGQAALNGIRVQNFGPAPTGMPFSVGLYWSADSSFSTSNDVFAGSCTFPALQANQQGFVDPCVISVPSSLGPGVYFVVGYVDFNQQIAETNEGNNVKVQTQWPINLVR